MEAFFAKFRSVQPYLQTTAPPPARERRQSPAERERVRRHDQVHPVRRVHLLVPVVLGAARVRRAGRDRQRPPVHLRHRATTAATSGSRSSPTRTACGAAGRSSTARTRARAGSTSPRRSSRFVGDRGATRLSEPALPVYPHLVDPHRRCGPRQPGAGVAGRGADRRLAAGRAGPAAPPDATISEALGVQTNNVAEWTGVVRALELAQRLGRAEGRPVPGLEADRRAAPRPVAGQGREAAAAVGRGEGDAGAGSSAGRRRTCRGPRTRPPTALANEALDRVAAGGPAMPACGAGAAAARTAPWRRDPAAWPSRRDGRPMARPPWPSNPRASEAAGRSRARPGNRRA